MRLCLIFVCTLLTIAGCSKTEKRLAVSGTVMNGTIPLASGVIRFVPEKGGSVSANIVDGKYEAQVVAGKNKVVIEAVAPFSTVPVASGEKPHAKELPTIPAKYKTGVPTEVTGPNSDLNFDLSK